MDYLHEHQLGIMLFMSGVCGILIFMTLMAEFLTGRRKCILAFMEVSAMLLLLFERWAYIFRGDLSELGFLMVRLSNGMVFLLTLLVPLLVTHYMKDMYRNEGGMTELPKRLALCDALFVIGGILLVISQFTGLYYTIDAQNIYHRAPGFIFSYLMPLLMVAILESVLLQHNSQLSKRFERALALCIALPFLVAVIQIFAYGLSLTTLTMVLVVILFFCYALNTLSNKVEEARIRQIEFYKEAQRREKTLFEQTTEALANAIDAKDNYTRGHSARVATISRRIAQEDGLSEEECSHVYFAALLHDVGKIGIRNEIINKTGRLTDEEFAIIKTHPALGYQILSSIRQSPYLSLGAHYHHERYDGKGYPEALAGEAIPRIARIIAVADAYDAMTSTRSYRGPLSLQKVKEELTRGIGTQFDPHFAQIMLQLLEGSEGKAGQADTGNLFLTPADRYIDLHLHLDGAVTSEIARRLAQMQDIPLPEEDAELEKLLTVSPGCRDLNEFLKCFQLPLSLMQTEEGLTEAVRLVADNIRSQGVIYAEIRLAPQYHTEQGMSQEDVVKAALKGIEKTDLKVNLILCCMRGEGNEAANEETLALAQKYLVKDGGVVAIDLAGAEALYPTRKYMGLFQKARQMGIPFTIHAGEAAGADSVRAAIECGAKRIGHGVRSFEDPEVVELLKEKRIILEMCPTSNRQTHAVEDMSKYPFMDYLSQSLLVTLNTDDMGIEGTTLGDEFRCMELDFGLDPSQERTILENAVDGAFTDEKTKDWLRKALQK